MTVKDLMNADIFELINAGEDPEKEIAKPFCCDLLSVAMSKAPEGGCWVTVMSNVNTLAVAALSDTACIVLAEGMNFDERCREKAEDEGITVFRTEMPVYEAARKVEDLIRA